MAIDVDEILFDLSFESCDFQYIAEFLDIDKTKKSLGLTMKDFEKSYDDISNIVKRKFKSTQNYIKSVAIKGNAAIDKKVDSIISAKKHEMLNKMAKGATKAAIVTALLAVLVAAIVIPGGGIAAGAGMSRVAAL